MTSKRIVKAIVALCLAATFWVAASGCDDLGAYDSEAEYYSSFGDVVLIGGTSRQEKAYSVEEYFYNKESKEDFLEGEDNAYHGVEHSDYVYMAIPLKNHIEMDTLALYLQSKNDVTVYINVFVTEKIPSEWKGLEDLEGENESLELGEDAEPKVYDDPDPATRVGEIAVHLKGGEWSSFLLESFEVNGVNEKSIQIEDGQYILIQIRNNSGVRIFDEERQIYVDPQTGMELQKAELTMTNLMIRALNVKNEIEGQGGEE